MEPQVLIVTSAGAPSAAVVPVLAAIEAAGLKVADRLETRPKHPKAADASDPLYQARKKEVTSLWRLA